LQKISRFYSAFVDGYRSTGRHGLLHAGKQFGVSNPLADVILSRTGRIASVRSSEGNLLLGFPISVKGEYSGSCWP